MTNRQLFSAWKGGQGVPFVPGAHRSRSAASSRPHSATRKTHQRASAAGTAFISAATSKHGERYQIFARVVPEVAFGFPAAQRAIPFQQHGPQRALQCKDQRGEDFALPNAAVYNLPADQIQAVYAGIDKEQKQNIPHPKPPGLAGQGMYRLQKIRVGRKQRTQRRIQAEKRQPGTEHHSRQPPKRSGRRQANAQSPAVFAR